MELKTKSGIMLFKLCKNVYHGNIRENNAGIY
jgi:hypothetical protein